MLRYSVFSISVLFHVKYKLMIFGYVLAWEETTEGNNQVECVKDRKDEERECIVRVGPIVCTGHSQRLCQPPR